MMWYRNLLTVIGLLLINLFSAQSCNFDDFVNDLSQGNAVFKSIVNEEDGFKAWQILAEEAPALRKNADELNLVSKNLSAIEKAGGYKKWKGTGSLEDFSNLLKNPKFKQIYEPLENGSHVRKFGDKITIAEEASLKLFIQDNYYSDFNKALAGEIPMTSEYKEIKKLMESAQSKLPKYNGTVFRGAGKAESDFAKKINVGEEFDFKGRFT
ncbi:hypothetical protein QWZ06_15660 [Chryseobacterium tructae]|uniref:Uncharacterized protein n=2 Tax=Chryseobacterium TaxID=59732 RepID=A0ABV7XY31_9FLAO|nr:hypothetical protein [Chryseobacterium tructae]MDN3693622.1 hypothetical protein [Chryseobacterium tructae]